MAVSPSPASATLPPDDAAVAAGCAAMEFLRVLLSKPVAERKVVLDLLAAVEMKQLESLRFLPPPTNRRVDDVVAAFLLSCAEDGKPAATLLHYEGRLKKFRIAFADRDFASLSADEILSHLDEVGRKSSDATRGSNMRVLLALENWAINTGLLYVTRLLHTSAPRPVPNDRFPTQEEFDRLVNAAPERLRVVLEAICAGMAKPGDIACALIEDIDESTDTLTVSNNVRTRPIKLRGRFGEIVRKEVGCRARGPIFLRKADRPWTVQTLSAAFRRLRSRLGLDKRITLQSIRNMHAARIYQEHGAAAASAAMGIEDLKLTRLRFSRFHSPSQMESTPAS